jgi:hypothetical protein
MPECGFSATHNSGFSIRQIRMDSGFGWGDEFSHISLSTKKSLSHNGSKTLREREPRLH